MVAAVMPGESTYQRYRKLIHQLKQERATWEGHWRDLVDFLVPRRGRLLGDAVSQANKGDKRMTSILDATATKDLRTLSSGMMTGITSPASEWFELATPDDDLNASIVGQRWLEESQHRISNLFRGSNLYNVLPETYLDLGAIGTSAVDFVEDDEDVFRFHQIPVGAYYLASDDRGVIDTCVRDRAMTVRQVVSRYGYGRCSTAVQAAWKNGQFENMVAVCQVITPNHEYEPKRIGGRFKAWRSCHFEVAAAQEKKFLRESGFDEFPILPARWATVGENVYGESPSMDVLPDVKALQVLERRLAQGIEKQVNPPLMAPADLASGEVDTRPNAVNYYTRNAQATQAPILPIYQVQLQLAELRATISDKRMAIHRGLFADLFLMLTNDARAQPPTAAEIYARQEEKLLVLGPVLERLNDEFLDPLVGRAFSMAARRGLIPQPPEEMQGMPLSVRYVSVMAKAQKLAGLSSQERFIGHVMQLGTVDPTALDRVNLDQHISIYGDRVGAPSKTIRSDEEVAAIRQGRAQAQQAQQASELAQAGAKTARDLSQASLDGNSALAAIAARSAST